MEVAALAQLEYLFCCKSSTVAASGPFDSILHSVPVLEAITVIWLAYAITILCVAMQ